MFLIASDETQILLDDAIANSNINPHLPLMVSNIKVTNREESKEIKMQMDGERLSRPPVALGLGLKHSRELLGSRGGAQALGPRRGSCLDYEHIKGGKKSQNRTTETAPPKNSSLVCVQEKKSSAQKLQWPKLLIISEMRPLLLPQ